VGGQSDVEICRRIEAHSNPDRVWSFAGELSLLESAELIRRCAVLISNDSAPMHLGVAVRTPVIAIFGATVPEFGFAPHGTHDEIVEVSGLACRPCGIHGGRRCPIGTFDCMLNITPDDVLSQVHRILRQSVVEN
jgi:heptosyltransferase-2